VQYPASGDVGLARRAVELLGVERAAPSTDWGLDHGTWSVLLHLRPLADVPVVQLSLNEHLPPAEHLALGRALAPLRDEGVLVMGSGNLVHNLGHAMRSYQRGDLSTPAWASAFDADVARAVEEHDHEFLARAVGGESGRMSHPTLDHYLPLLYAAGAAGGAGTVSFPITGFDLGSLSMRSILFH
jgi:4,5-DOPA dioxygenase extradiol